MDTFELDSDAFYICTEISPQNFVVQKAIQIDKSQLERMVGKFDGKSTVEKAPTSPESSLGTSPSPGGTSPSTSALGVNGNSQVPPIPYWFDRECKTRLMMLGPQPQGPPNLPFFPSSSTHFGPPTPAPPVTHEDLKQQLKNQLEYYFSRENLISDRYLKCQMDEEHFVPIAVVAEFRKIRNLTNDIDLIVEALKDSMVVELDENCEKVRAITKRTTLIIREIPEDRRDLVEQLLVGGPKYTELKYGLNKSWYVTFEKEIDTQVAYVGIQAKNNDATNGRVCARIKAGGVPASGPNPDAQNGDKDKKPTATVSNGENNQIQLRELGQTLSDYGFVPVASYRPGESNLSHFSYQSRTCHFEGNSLGYTHPPPPLMQNSLMDPQLQTAHFYYQSPVSTAPRTFDEYSTASSNSTHTTASNHNNRSGSSNGGVGGANNYYNQYNESRSSFSNSNEWRGRGGSGGRFQNNHNHSETNGRQTNGRGNWRGARNGTLANGHGNQNHRQNGQQNNWRNEQSNGHHNNWRNDQNVPHNNWKNEQNGHHQNGYRNHENGHHNNWKNENRSQSSNQWWITNNGENCRSYNNHHNNRQNPPVLSSSSSSLSSKLFSPNAVETPTNFGSSTPPPSAPGKQQYTPPTPSDMPPPPVWPAPNYDRRRKSSEASSTTITANTGTNTLTPSTPVISAEDFPAFADTQEHVEKSKDVKEKQWKEKPVKEKSVETVVEKSKTVPKVETTKSAVVEKEKLRSPPVAPVVAPVPAPAPSFAFEENAFPSLPKKVEPVKPPQKPTFR